MGFGKAFKRVFRPVRKVVKKIIPKEIKPFLPYAAAAFGPAGLAGTQFATMNPAFQKALIAGITSAATDEQGNPLRTALLAGAPDVLSKGLGSAGRVLGNVNPESKLAQFLVSKGTGLETTLNNPGLNMSTAKILGAQASVDQAAKLAEINQDEIDKYNEQLRKQGVLDKTKRRTSIYNIYINAGYEPDYVNNMLDRYGYAEGGILGAAAARMSLKDFAKEIRKKQKKKKEKKASGGRIGFNRGGRAEIITGLLNIKDADGNLIYSYEEAVDKANEILPDEVSPTDLQTAASGIEKAFGRAFGNVEPVPMLKFAQGGRIGLAGGGNYESYKDFIESTGDDELMDLYIEFLGTGDFTKLGDALKRKGYAKGGEIEIEEETDDLNILDFMKDQGIEYGEQASYGYDEAMSDSFDMFQDYRKRGLIPMDMEFDEFLEIMRDSKKSKDGIMQMASGYKTDIEEMYEQYVFEMEEQGLQPMSFSQFLARERAGMAGGGKVKRRKKGEPEDEIIETEEEIFIDNMPRPKKQGILGAADGGIMEKDMRGGGFIPEGTKERADDVPARLSKNEFVMTADAVRGAGGGSVNEGAKRMYDMMYQLEGKI